MSLPGDSDPTKRTSDDIHEAIIASTIEVLDELGPINLTVAEVARRAGCTTGALYSHFENREGLLTAAYLAKLAELRYRDAAVAKLAAEVFASKANDVNSVRDLELGMSGLDNRRSRLWVLEAVVMARTNDALRDALATRFATMRARVAESVRASQLAGITRSDLDADAIAVVWIGSMLGFSAMMSAAPEADHPLTPEFFAAWDAMIHLFNAERELPKPRIDP